MDASMEDKKRKFTDWWNQKGVVVGGQNGVFKDPDIDRASIVFNKSYWRGASDKYIKPEEAASLEPAVL